MIEIDSDLCVGDQYDAQDSQLLRDYGIDYVVTLCIHRNDNTDIHHPLVDGENQQSQFDHAVDLVHEARIQRDLKVLVHCAAGVSRSVTVAATSLAAEQGSSIDEALEQVKAVHGAANPEPTLLTQAEKYL